LSSQPDPAGSKLEYQCTNKTARVFSQLQNLSKGTNSIERKSYFVRGGGGGGGAALRRRRFCGGVAAAAAFF